MEYDLEDVFYESYEEKLLHGNFNVEDSITNTKYEEINGARIIDSSLKVELSLNKTLENSEGYKVGDWTLKFKRGNKLGQFLDRVPFGIIDKTITGLGATTLEIETPVRNSIIVVPTKALAYNKVKSTNNKRNESYCLYVGSPIGDIKSDFKKGTIQDYLENRGVNVKKFVVVADSLPKLISFLEELEEPVYGDYFLLIDEIDTMQMDSAYRPRLEATIDYYARFKFFSKAIVSATLIPFSNPLLNSEAKLRIEYDVQPIRKIKAIYTNYVDDIAWELINDLIKTDAKKILVAYNSIDGIINIQKHLRIPNNECGILCSERSDSKVKDFIPDALECIDVEGKLLKRVTFLTCAYFAGIDIADKCHLIIISSRLQPFTYLSTERMTQIAGRCRPGLWSETIIYDIPQKVISVGSNQSEVYRNNLVNRAFAYAKVLNDLSNLVNQEPHLKPLKKYIDSYMDFISQCKPIHDDYPLTILRQNYINSEFVPAYFNIDALTERNKLKMFLYSNKKNLINELKAAGHKVFYSWKCLKKEKHDTASLEIIKEKKAEEFINEIEKVKEFIIDKVNNDGIEISELEKFANDFTKRVKDNFIFPYIMLSPFIESDYLISQLELRCNDKRQINNFINGVLFYCLPMNNPFKASLFQSFEINTVTMRSRRRFLLSERIKIIQDSFLNTYNIPLTNINDKKIESLLTSFFKWSRGTSGVGNKITGINPFEIPLIIKELPDNFLFFEKLKLE